MEDLSGALRDFVAELARLSPGELTPDGVLFASGIIDSLNLLELVTWVEKRCAIRVPAGDLTLDNWNTLRSIEAYVARRTGA